MRKRVFEALRNPRRGRSIEACTTATVATALAALSLLSDLVSDNVRWAAVLAGLGLLIHHVTRPEQVVGALSEEQPYDRGGHQPTCAVDCPAKDLDPGLKDTIQPHRPCRFEKSWKLARAPHIASTKSGGRR